MFNLKSIQKTILIISIAVFLLSFILILFYAISSPKGFLAASLGTKPITAFTNTDVELYSYGDLITSDADIKIKDNKTTIVATNINTTLTTERSMDLNGLIYIKTTDAMSIKLSPIISVELLQGEYFVNSNPIKIHVLSGSASFNQDIIAAVNQSTIWQVDNFRTNNLNTDDFVLNKYYSDLITLLKDINLIPSQLSTLSLNIEDLNTIIVNNEEDIVENEICNSDLINDQLLCDINSYRAENNLNKLIKDESLDQLSLSHAIWMQNNESISTIESNGLSYLERCNEQGFNCIAEVNLKVEGYNSLTLYNLVIQNKNILSKDASLVGINIVGDYLSILIR